MNAREQAEARQREAEERMQRMLEDMERAKRELAEAHSTIHSLEAQLKQLQLVGEIPSFLHCHLIRLHFAEKGKIMKEMG